MTPTQPMAASATASTAEKVVTVRSVEPQEEQPVRPKPDVDADPDAALHKCPVFVMLPLDTVCVRNVGDGNEQSMVQSSDALDRALDLLKLSDVQGVMVDVWWGICERDCPRKYDFRGYRELFNKVAAAGLEVQAVMSFHAAGTNVGDTCTITLPPWVLETGEMDPDIFYTDQRGVRNCECLSTGCLQKPVLHGRTPMRAYTDFVQAFCNEFEDFLGVVVTEITIGCGPAGELRYPAYPEGDRRWRFPGVGEFQCYDKYMLQSLREAAEAVGHPEWGKGGPHDAGHYNSHFWETEFFRDDGRWNSEYGRFFLSWYSGKLIHHADCVLGAVRAMINREVKGTVLAGIEQGDVNTYRFESRASRVKLGVKLAGVHWCSKSLGHGAELTAGYYNTAFRNGYADIFEKLSAHDAVASYTCVEMRDCEHPAEGACGPEALLTLVAQTAGKYGVKLTGENALQRYDNYAFDRMYQSAMGASACRGTLSQLTFLRMGNPFFDNWDAFQGFMKKMGKGKRV